MDERENKTRPLARQRAGLFAYIFCADNIFVKMLLNIDDN